MKYSVKKRASKETDEIVFETDDIVEARRAIIDYTATCYIEYSAEAIKDENEKREVKRK